MKKKKTKSLPADEVSLFCQQAAMILKAGIPLYDGMEVLYQNYKDTPYGGAFQKIYEGVRDGGSLYEGIKEAGYFPNYMVHMVQVGETAGELDRVAFIPASGFSGTVNIYFQARSTNSEEFEGMVEIQVERPSAAVTVRYSTRSAPVGFRGSDFGRSGSNLSSIRFSSMPASTAGHLYYRYTSPTRYDRQASTASSYNVSGSNLISDLSFVPKAGFSGTVVLPYTGTNSNNSTFEGEVVITVAPSYTTSYFNDLGQYDNQQRSTVN